MCLYSADMMLGGSMYVIFYPLWSWSRCYKHINKTSCPANTGDDHLILGRRKGRSNHTSPSADQLEMTIKTGRRKCDIMTSKIYGLFGAIAFFNPAFETLCSQVGVGLITAVWSSTNRSFKDLRSGVTQLQRRLILSYGFLSCTTYLVWSCLSCHRLRILWSSLSSPACLSTLSTVLTAPASPSSPPHNSWSQTILVPSRSCVSDAAP
ncbi:uncharacterized protein [Nothobranchius furzeri]|uniref:uncharacterized protein n=1 Tax=Nothobranchius furzeri TaxID=105023 RepID=UPI0039046AEA